MFWILQHSFPVTQNQCIFGICLFLCISQWFLYCLSVVSCGCFILAFWHWRLDCINQTTMFSSPTLLTCSSISPHDLFAYKSILSINMVYCVFLMQVCSPPCTTWILFIHDSLSSVLNYLVLLLPLQICQFCWPVLSCMCVSSMDPAYLLIR